MTGAGDGTHALLVLGFESREFPVAPMLAQALESCGDHGGNWDEPGGEAPADGAADGWRDALMRAPYVRDVLVAMGVISETFETARVSPAPVAAPAVTWDRFEELHAAVPAQITAAVQAV